VLNRSAIILSDLHLGPTCPKDTEQAAVTVIRRHPGADVLLLGDTLDLSIDPPRNDPAQSAAKHLADHLDFRLALREQLQRGAAVMLFAGNHDARLAEPGVRAQLLSQLDLTDDAPLHCGLWCLQRAGVHLEHGNLYDPDNTHGHPLVAPGQKLEPLGIAMMRSVLAPTNALFFAHESEITPWAGLTQAFVRMGARAPQLIARYYYESMRIFIHAKPKAFAEAWRIGDRRLAEYAFTHSLDVQVLERLLELRALPRHQNKKDVFFRLYLDRSLATALWWSCGLLGAVTANAAALGLSGLGLGYLGLSLSRGKNRYSGNLVLRLQNAALAVRRSMGASAVIFGHTHVEEQCPGYVNTGSFGFGGKQGRTYLLLEDKPSLFRMSVSEGNAPRPLAVFLSNTDVVNTKPGVAA
jgi:UDP-2,3-diacylglucosamine pyrophosphatase LpxH